MARVGDTAPLERRLTMTNFAESSESNYHVKRISFVGKILDDADIDAETRFKALSEADQQVLNWQTSPEGLQTDDEVCLTLMQESGRLCPCKSFSFSFCSSVKSDDDSLRRKLGEHPLSAYEQISFRTAMLTKYSAVDGRQPELLAIYDGLGGEHSFLRWRSHDYIKVSLCKPREYFRVFWLIRWDIVGKLRSADVAPEPEPAEKPPGRIRPPLKRPRQRSRFHSVRCNEQRKLPWVAEVRRKGERKKIWLGSYGTEEAAARAADVGNHYHDRDDLLNFVDTPTNLEPFPLVLSEKDKQMFVRKEAKRIARLSETQPSTLPLDLTPCTESSNDGCNSTAGNTQQPETLEVRATSNHVQVFTEFNGGDAFPETVGILPVATQTVWPSTPPGSSFVSALSPGSPALEQAHLHPSSLSPEFIATDPMMSCGLFDTWGYRFVGISNLPGDFAEYSEYNGDWEGDVEGLIFNH